MKGGFVYIWSAPLATALPQMTNAGSCLILCLFWGEIIIFVCISNFFFMTMAFKNGGKYKAR